MSRYLKWAITVLLILTLCIPTAFVIVTSIIQLQKYRVPSNLIAVERSYGDPVLLQKREFIPVLILEGRIKANEKRVLTYSSSNCSSAVFLVGIGDEILIDQPLIHCGSKLLYSTVNGIISDIMMGNNILVAVDTFDNLVFETFVEPEHVHRYQKNMETPNYNLIYRNTSSVVNERNLIGVVYKITSSESVYVNQEIEIFVNLIDQKMVEYVAIKEAIFLKSSKPYIRVVSNDRSVIGDYEVAIISEGVNQYAFRFIDSLSEPVHIDIEYGVYMNRLYGDLVQ